MANLAKIQSIAQGQFFVKDSLGNLVELKVGDTVSLNDIIVAASSNTDLSKIEILFDTNELIILSQGEQLLDATLLASTFGNEELAFDKQEVDETLNAWNNAQDGDATDMETAAGDVTEQATNAGDERAADGGALRSKFNSRDGASTNVESDLRDTSFGGGNTEEPQEQIPTELLNPVGTTTPTTPTTPTIPVDTRVPASVITLSDPTVKEGEKITITATVTNPPQTDLIITLSNGKTTQTITISAGQTTGSVKFDNPNGEDVYKDGETLNYTITGTTGGNYVSLDASDSSFVTIEDTIDTTTVKLTSTGTLTEDGGDVTYSVDLGAGVRYGDSSVTVTFKDILGNEKTITINPPANQGDAPVTTGKIIVPYKEAELAREDVYVENIENLSATDAKVTGGNFEKLGSVTIENKVTLKDSEDPTTVTIKGNNVNEGGKATFEIQLSNPPQKGVPLETVIADFTGRNHKQNELINDGWKIEGDGSMEVGKYDGKTGSSERLLIRDQNDGNDNPTTVTSPTFKIVEGDSGKVSFNFYGSNYNSKDNSFTWKVEKLDTKTGKWEVVQEETISKSIGSGGEQLVTTNSLGGGEYRVVYEVKTGEDNKHYKGTENEKSANYGVYIDNVKVTTEKTTGKVQVGDKTYDVVFDEDGKATLKVPVKGNDHYIGEPTLTAKVTEINGGNYEKVDLNTTENNSKIIVKDTTDTTKVTITAVQTTDKVIDIKNLQNNAGFNVFAKDPYGNDAKISIHGNPAGFGVQSDKETTSGKLGQTNQVYSGHTSEIGVVKDGDTYKSESIEVVFKNPIQTLDVAFAWRHNGERAKVDFYNGDTKVGYAIVKGGGSNTDAIVEYYIGDEKTPHITFPAQGGTDKVDLVYTFKPANNVSFTKAVFSADGAGSDYLIHSIKYKEAVGEDSTTVVGSQEVAFKIETSVKPDSIWIAEGNTPTAYVKIVDSNGNEVFKDTVNLDKNGNAIVTVRTDGKVTLTAEVKNVQGNFEEVDYTNAKTTVAGTLIPTAGNDSITINEDTQYTLTKDDFGNKDGSIITQNVAKIKFDTAPSEYGKLYVLKKEYTGSMNHKAEYSESTKNLFDEIKAGDIIDISKIESGSVIFVPKEHTDKDSEFTFSVSNGNGKFSEKYTTDINVKAVADAAEVSIDVIKGSPLTQDNIVTIKTLVDTPMKEVKLNVTDKDARNANKIEIKDSNLYEAQNGNNHTNGHLAFKNVNKSLFIVENNPEKPIIIFGNQKNSTFDVNGTIKFVDGLDAISISNAAIIINNTIDTIKVSKNSDGTFSGKIGSTTITNVKAIAYKGGIIGELSSFNANLFEIDYDAIKNQNLVQENGQYFKVTTETTTEIVGYKYEIKYSAKLTDTDGSEKLSDFIIKNLPEGSKLFGVDKQEIKANSDGSYTVKVDETGKAKLTLESQDKLSEDELNSIKASATSNEVNEKGEITDSATTTASSKFGQDIDLTGLKNILEGQKTGDIDLSKNGSQDKLTLTLDDVLELSGDDGKIKITGDMFDSVALKNEDGKAWKQETSITENNKTFDVYSGSIGDQTVQVKVEQPISDGITS